MIRIKQLLTLFAFVPALSLAQTTTDTVNYVKTETMLDASGTNSVKAVQYYNGLGYPTIAVANTGDAGETAYSLVTYDALGREERKFLPVSTGKSILYKTPDVITQESQSSNGYGDQAAYSLAEYDALDRPVSVTTPGSAFASNPSKIDYAANAANEVICYGVGSTNNLTQNSFYPTGKLTKETSTDPDGKKVETYKDFFGNVILQRVGGTLCTYYVYDDLGHLRFVLPPKYQAEKDIAKTGYEYRYDDRGRVVYKKLPGAEYCEYNYATSRGLCRMPPFPLQTMAYLELDMSCHQPLLQHWLVPCWRLQTTMTAIRRTSSQRQKYINTSQVSSNLHRITNRKAC